jgi:DNA-binding FadR family transcriptional regulator
MKPRPIQRRKIHEDVAAQIEEMIASGEYAEGDQLPSERELMEGFGVGRPAVREALLSLQKMGLVALSSGERARVVRPTVEALVGQLSGAARHLLGRPDGIREFQDARRVFEAAIARRAAERALEANEAALGAVPDFERTDVAFHLVLAELSGNSIFVALHHAIVEWLTKQRTVSLRNPGADRRAFESHRRIRDAVAAHDPEGAWQAMDAHLAAVNELYWQGLETGKSDERRLRYSG